MKFDRYELFARIFPSIICGLPVFFFYHFYINSDFSNLLHSTLKVNLISDIPMSVVLLFCSYQIVRFFGKNIESLYFDNERKFPTTEFLLYKNNEYSTEYKNKIREKIHRNFNNILLNQIQEKRNDKKARKLIVESVRQIRGRVKEGRLVLNRNIEFGFFRNLTAGGLIALPITAFASYFFKYPFPNQFAFNIEALSFCLFFILAVFSYPILKFLGKNYANTLYQEYLEG